MLYEVEFWPGKKFRTEATSEADALMQVMHDEMGWAGGIEITEHGTEFKAWVREV